MNWEGEGGRERELGGRGGREKEKGGVDEVSEGGNVLGSSWCH